MKIGTFLFGKTTASRIRSCVGLVVLLCIGGCFYKCVSFLRPPLREEPLRIRFQENVSTFEELRQMVQADTNLTCLSALFPDSTRHNDFSGVGLPPDRFNRYLALLGQVSAETIYHDRDRGDIGIGLASAGGFDWGWSISIVWRESQPTNVVSNWQDLRKGPEGTTYKALEGNWYFRMWREVAHFENSSYPLPKSSP